MGGEERGGEGMGGAAPAALTVVRHHRLSLVQLLRGPQVVLDALELRRQRGERGGGGHLAATPSGRLPIPRSPTPAPEPQPEPSASGPLRDAGRSRRR